MNLVNSFGRCFVIGQGVELFATVYHALYCLISGLFWGF